MTWVFRFSAHCKPFLTVGNQFKRTNRDFCFIHALFWCFDIKIQGDHTLDMYSSVPSDWIRFYFRWNKYWFTATWLGQQKIWLKKKLTDSMDSYFSRSNRWICRCGCIRRASLACHTVMVQMIQRQPSNGTDSCDLWCRSPWVDRHCRRDTNHILSSLPHTIEIDRFVRSANDKRCCNDPMAHRRLELSTWCCCLTLL